MPWGSAKLIAEWQDEVALRPLGRRCQGGFGLENDAKVVEHAS